LHSLTPTPNPNPTLLQVHKAKEGRLHCSSAQFVWESGYAERDRSAVLPVHWKGSGTMVVELPMVARQGGRGSSSGAVQYQAVEVQCPREVYERSFWYRLEQKYGQGAGGREAGRAGEAGAGRT
jgi:hypothetical protein